MPGPLDRLSLAQQKSTSCSAPIMRARIPRCWFVVVQSAASDWAAARLAVAIERAAEALLAEDEPVPQKGPGIVRAHG
jgi:hypothetical protein